MLISTEKYDQFLQTRCQIRALKKGYVIVSKNEKQHVFNKMAASNKNISPKIPMRRQILKYHYDNGITNPRILSELSNITLRQIYNQLPRLENNESLENRPGQGAKSVLKKEDRMRISSLASNHPKWSC